MKNIKTFEIYSDKDMSRGKNLDDTLIGINFPGDYRKQKLIIKKLLRLKAKIQDQNLKNEVDQILDMME